MANARQLSRTVTKIYAAATNPSLWRDALLAVEDYTGSTGAVLDFVPLNDHALPRTLAGSFSGEDCRDYALHYQAICPRIRFGREHPEISVHYDRLIMSEHEMDRDATYNWLGSHGLRYFVAGRCGLTDRYMVYFSCQRTRVQGHVDTADVQRFELVRPHIAQAAALSESFNHVAAHDRFGEAMLDSVSDAAFALDSAGQLLFANSAGELMLETGEYLAFSDPRLCCLDPAQQAQLDALILSVLSGGCGGVMRLASATGQRAALLRVSPIAGDADDLFVQPAVLVIVRGPDEGVLDEAAAAALYDLTPAEARTAATFVAGHSIESAARDLLIGTETVRSHLKALFRKLGVSRQQDLIRILAGLRHQP